MTARMKTMVTGKKWISLVALVATGACAPAATPDQGDRGAVAAIRLALNWKPEPEFGGFYAAVESKSDTENGVKMTLLEGGSGTPTVQMLANSQVDFAVVSAEEILIANERNPKNRVIAVFAVYQINPTIIMCHAEKGFKSLREVFAAPVTLAWQSGLTYAQFLRKRYADGLKAKLVPYMGGISAFLADKNMCQQGFVTSEPISAEKAGAKVKSFLAADEGFNPYTVVLAVREGTLKQNSDLVRKVVKAVKAGWDRYLKDPVPTNKVMHGLNKAMDLDSFNKSAQTQRDLIKPDELGKMKAERWHELAETLKSLKVIERVPPAGLEPFYEVNGN